MAKNNKPADQDLSQEQADEQPKNVPSKTHWLVWLLRSSAAIRTKLILAAQSADEAWHRFCEINKIDQGTEGGRVIRPALESEFESPKFHKA